MTDTSRDTYSDTDTDTRSDPVTRTDPGTRTDPEAATQQQDPTLDSMPAHRRQDDDAAAPATMSQPSAEPDDDQRLSTSDLANRGQQAPEQDGRDTVADEDDAPPLVTDPDQYLTRWQSVQAGFVDEPRSAVQDADALVAEVIQRIAEGFAEERDRLEHQWSGGENVDTEQLRIALQRYRSFFTRLLQT
jgi:hypothetical protein